MKISELLETPYQTRVKNKTVDKDLDYFTLNVGKINPKYDPKQGMYSVVTPDNSDPHMVRKTSKAPRKPDFKEGFVKFVEYIIENKHQDNIHFPRIYDVKSFTDKNGLHIESFQIEKLVDAKYIDPDVLIDYQESLLGWRPRYDEWEQNYTIADKIRTAVYKGQSGVFESEELNQACDILAKARIEVDSYPDIHSGNIMYRQTRYGIQLVITDPFS